MEVNANLYKTRAFGIGLTMQCSEPGRVTVFPCFVTERCLANVSWPQPLGVGGFQPVYIISLVAPIGER